MTQKEQAQKILTDFGLLEYLNAHCGKTHVVGSYAMDLMAANDLDIDVENKNMSQEKLYALSAFVNKTFHPSWYEAKQVFDKYGDVTWFCGFEFSLDGALWNVDLWFLDEYTISIAESKCEFVRSRTEKDPSIAARIVQLKKELMRRNLYGGDNYTSDNVYDAVIHNEVTDVDEFLRLKNRGNAVDRYVKVSFDGGSYCYTYKCTNLDVEVGDVVDAPSNNYALYQPALVKKIEYLTDYQLPIRKDRILTLDKIISKQDADCLFDKVGFIKSKIDKELVKEWRFVEDNGYYKGYESTFGGTITYQPDDAFMEFWIGDMLEPDLFIDNVNTNMDHFDDKIQFVETLLSQLYYGKINDDQFFDTLDKMTGGIRYNHCRYRRKN